MNGRDAEKESQQGARMFGSRVAQPIKGQGRQRTNEYLEQRRPKGRLTGLADAQAYIMLEWRSSTRNSTNEPRMCMFWRRGHPFLGGSSGNRRGMVAADLPSQVRQENSGGIMRWLDCMPTRRLEHPLTIMPAASRRKT